jgi:uncharacterized protein (DUF2235 family)
MAFEVGDPRGKQDVSGQVIVNFDARIDRLVAQDIANSLGYTLSRFDERNKIGYYQVGADNEDEAIQKFVERQPVVSAERPTPFQYMA